MSYIEDMNTTTKTSARARREYNTSLTSLANAEELRDMLAAHPLPENGYYDDALAKAEQLVDEMNADLDDVMSRYTPEECGL